MEGLGDKVAEMRYPENTGVEVIKMLDERLKRGEANTKNGIFSIVNDASRQNPRPEWNSLMTVRKLLKLIVNHESS
jgi:hypothetical protein